MGKKSKRCRSKSGSSQSTSSISSIEIAQIEETAAQQAATLEKMESGDFSSTPSSVPVSSSSSDTAAQTSDKREIPRKRFAYHEWAMVPEYASSFQGKTEVEYQSRSWMPSSAVVVPGGHDIFERPNKRRRLQVCSSTVNWGEDAINRLLTTGETFEKFDDLENIHGVEIYANIDMGILKITGSMHNVAAALGECHDLAFEGEGEGDLSRPELMKRAEEVFVQSRSERGTEFRKASEDALDFLKEHGVSEEDAVPLLKEVLWKWSETMVYAVHRRDGK